MLPGYDTVETLYRSNASYIQRCRRQADGLNVIIKGYYDANIPAAVAGRLRYEYKILQVLSGAQARNVVRPIELCDTTAQVAIVLEDIAGTSLRAHHTVTPLTWKELLHVAGEVTLALQDSHGARVVHKDINPANIIFNAFTGQVQLIDFGIAATISQELQTVDNFRTMEGTLSYVSPEQTGKTNRLLDYRTDFYSLGVTLYELLGGSLPFDDEDSAQLLHAILARMPAPLRSLNPFLPEPVVRIVAKLMEKAPENRYQSASGLHHDLQFCRQPMGAADAFTSFTPGAHDRSEHFEIPQKLYGRHQEVQTLREAYGRVAQKTREVLLISGSSGIGKSALVNELQRALVEHQGLFLSGKYDQLRRHVPFSAFGQATAVLVRRVLMEDPVMIRTWQRLIQDVMGNVGQALVDIAPSLELLVGPQKAVPPLGPQETENRLLTQLQRFVRALCSMQPVVLFLDDLQWADVGTLRLLTLLCQNETPGAGLLMIGAYRDNEVTVGHPFTATLNAMKALSTPISAIRVAPLLLNDIVDMLTDATQQTPSQTQPLAAMILAKTAGNPFFVHTFVKRLWDKQLIRYLPQQHGWQWDLQAIRSAAVADNVVALVTEGLRDLGADQLELLGLAACLGTQFTLHTLSHIKDTPPGQVAELLQAALDTGVITPLASAYRYASEANIDIRYQFVHDRVQQAAYEALNPHTAVQMHHIIGQRLLTGHDVSRPGKWVFSVTDHLNHALSMIIHEHDRLNLAQLNLAAAAESRKAVSYAVALEYLQAALRCLPDDPWQSSYALMRQISLDIAAIEFLSGNLDKASADLDNVLTRSRTSRERAQVQHQRVLAMTALAHYDQAVIAGVEALRLLGLSMSAKPSILGVARALVNMRLALLNKNVRDLSRMPMCQDPHILQVYTLLTDMVMAAYFYHDMFFAQICVRLGYLTVRHGLSIHSTFAFMAYVAVLDRLSDFKHLWDFVYVAQACQARIPNSVMPGGAMFVKAAYADVNTLKPRQLSSRFDEALIAGVENGDPLYASWSSTLIVGYLLWVSLPHFLDSVPQHEDFVKLRNPAAHNLMRCEVQLARSLRGLTVHSTSFDDAGYMSAGVEAAFKIDKLGPAAGWYYAMRALILWLHRDMEGALQATLQSLERGVMELASENRVVAFYLALVIIDHGATRPNQRVAHPLKLRGLLRRLRAVGAVSPHIFAGFPIMVEAQWAAVRGDIPRATRLYEEAVEKLSVSGYMSCWAAGLECAGRAHAQWKMGMAAQAYLGRARDVYLEWGAEAKAHALEVEFAAYLARSEVHVSTTTQVTHQVAATTKHEFAHLELPAVLRACQAISGETSASKLLELIVSSLIECAGATRAALLSFDSARQPVLQVDSAPHEAGLPDELLKYVTRSKETLVLDHDGDAGNVKNDPYLLRVKPKSVMCAPIVLQNQVKGLIYLENNFVSDFFSANRLVSVRLLATQAMISLENARLLEHLEETVTTRTLELQAAHTRLMKLERESTELKMAGGFAHEMGNALSAASYPLQALAAGDYDADNQAEILSVVEKSVARGLRIVAQILTYAEINEGTRGNDHVSLAALVDHVLQELAPQPQHVQWSVQIDPALQWPMRREHAHTIVRNLLSNAFDAVEALGTLEADARPGDRVAVQATLQNDCILLNVHDMGVGIRLGDQPNIFQPFYSTKGTRGAGLGLGLARKLVELYGGAIAFSSTAENGTLFNVRVPL